MDRLDRAYDDILKEIKKGGLMIDDVFYPREQLKSVWRTPTEIEVLQPEMRIRA